MVTRRLPFASTRLGLPANSDLRAVDLLDDAQPMATQRQPSTNSVEWTTYQRALTVLCEVSHAVKGTRLAQPNRSITMY